MIPAIIHLILLPFFIAQADNQYVIHGSFNREQNEKWVYLVRFMDNHPKVDSTRIIDGKFTFTGTVDYPELYGISYHPDRNKGIAPVFLEPGNLEIVINLDDWTFGSEVTGGKVNRAYSDFAKIAKKRYTEKTRELFKKRRSASEQEAVEIDRQIKALMDADYQYRLDYVKAHPDAPESIFIFSWIFGKLSDDELEQMMSAFSPEIQKTAIYQRISREHEEELKLRNVSKSAFYDGKFETLDIRFGNQPVIRTLLQQNPGKTLYIDFWAPWCKPCREQFPYSRELHQKLPAGKVAFIYVCVNTSMKIKEEKWKETVIEEKLKGQHYLWGQSLINKFFKEVGSPPPGIPRYVVIDRTGKVISKNAPRPSSETIVKLLTGASE